MRNVLIIPMLILSLGLFACGKKKDDGIAIGGGPIVNPIPPPTNIPINGAFTSYCTANGGQLFSYSGQEACKFVLGGSGGSGYLTFCSLGDFSSAWYSGIELVVNDTVSVSASGHPDILVGSSKREYTNSFVSSTSGSLRFTNDNSCDDFFEVNSVTVKRCVTASSQAIPCPL